VLRSGKINQWTGPHVKAFEKEFAADVQQPYAVAVCNGTVAIDVLLRGFGIGAEDEVIVPCRSFVASASGVLLAGGIPVFADVDPVYGNIDVAFCEQLVTPKTKALMLVHMAGYCCDMDAIVAFCKKHSILLFEDCSQAHGAYYKGIPLGAFGDGAAWSFCQDKIITTGGEGGIITTKHKDAYERMWSMKDHGRNMEKALNPVFSGAYRYLIDFLGNNYRLTEMQAVCGRQGLKNLKSWTDSRRSNARKVVETVSARSGGLITFPPFRDDQNIHDVYYRLVGFVAVEKLHAGWDIKSFIEAMMRAGVPANCGSCCELYNELVFDKKTTLRAECANAKRFGEHSFVVLTHPTLQEEDVEWIAERILSVLEVAKNSAPANQ
jgi:dTDP-4-amino-4,6-dideoxygalactose transaminase